MKRKILNCLAVFAVLAALVGGGVMSGILTGYTGDATAQTYTTRQPGSNLVGYQDYSQVPGSVFWVSSGTGTDGAGYGRSPLAPVATVDYAIANLTTANKGDRIMVMPGHNEGGSAAIFDADIAGISIIGLGEGTDRPRFDYDGTAAIVSVGADNVTFRNLTFLPSVSAVVVGVNVEATFDHFTMEDCEFMVGEAAGTDEFISALVLNSTASYATIKGNHFYTDVTDTHCTNAINLGVGGAVARVEIVDNIMYGNWSTAAIIDGTTAVTEIIIRGNVIKVKDAEPAIELAATTTAIITDNRFECTGISSALTIVGADAAWIENYVTTTDGTVGELVGSSI